MIITAVRMLYGPYAPDPTYRNLYAYTCKDAGMYTANEIPYRFFAELRNADGTPVDDFIKDIGFPTGTVLYPIGESDTGFTIELPTDDGLPSKPLYIIVTDSTTATPVYRYAFIEGYQRTGAQKIRCACRFDQWTEHYAELMDAEMTFTRRHQKRYVDRTAATRTRLFNGLSDPVPEGMVQGTTKTDPVLVYGAKIATVADANLHTIVPLWLYWRLSTSDFFYKAHGAGDWGAARRLLGIDTPKFSVPVLATCLGVIDYNPQTELAAFRPTWKIYKSDNTLLTNCAEDHFGGTTFDSERGAMIRALATLGTGHPYIAQSWVTTIPPFPITVDFAPKDGVGTVTRPIIKIADSRFDNVMTPGDGNDYKIGQTSDDVPASLEVQRGTFIDLPYPLDADPTQYRDPFPVGVRQSLTLFDHRQTGAFVDAYEPKIEESPYEGRKLLLYGAEIDISPTPANPSLTLHVTTGAHGDLVITSSGTEVYRASGVCSQYGVDAATDSLTTWLVSNYQTYQNAKLWKTIGTALGSGTAIIGGAITENPAMMIGGIKAAVTGIGEMVTGENARYADLSASPNATTIASENAFDNFPFIDLPRIKKRTIPSAIKTSIMNFWHVYGYPDNKIGTMTSDAMLRESFSYVQGAFVNNIPGLYPSQIAEVVAAIRSGAWLWVCGFVNDERKNLRDVHHYWTYVNRQTPLLNLPNKEVV